MRAKEAQSTPLKRSLSLTLMIFYGLGTKLGAGLYALIGKVAVTVILAVQGISWPVTGAIISALILVVQFLAK